MTTVYGGAPQQPYSAAVATNHHPPTTTAAVGGGGGTTSTHEYPSSNAVCRSAELLSCAKTALKIVQNRHVKQQQQQQQHNHGPQPEEWFLRCNPADLHLHKDGVHDPHASSSATMEILEDGLTLLRSMEAELQHLEGLVRRRGHTNDPTQEISATVSALEQDAAELTTVIQTLIPVTTAAARSQRSSNSGGGGQRQRHWQAVQQWLQWAAQQHATKLRDILAVRGTVLAEQARRRQRFQTNNTTTTNNSNSYHQTAIPIPPPPSASANALFRALPPPLPQPQQPSKPPMGPLFNSEAAAANGQSPPPTTNGHDATINSINNNNMNGSTLGRSSSSSNGGYGGGVGPHHHYPSVAGYGGSARNATYYTGGQNTNTVHPYPSTDHHSSSSSTTGIRQRRGETATTSTTTQQQQQQQLVMRQQERQTAHRLNEARLAEKSLATLGTVFGKMSTLIAQQSETLDKVEDDVEAACFDVHAGHSEITTLYAIKKGNRALILKVFGMLIFLIVFMRFYVKR